MSVDLELATTEEIFAELAKRFGVVVIMFNQESKTNSDVDGTAYYCYGSNAAIVGMCEVVKARIVQDTIRGARATDEE